MGFDLGSVANIAGSLIGAGSSLAGGFINATTSKTIAREQMRLQKEFAQNGIQWRVADAKAAGLHPLYAIGASGASYTPVSQDSSAMGNAVADAGAYLGKAVDGSIDKETRKQIEEDNLAWIKEQRNMARRKELSDIMHSELLNRNLVLRNEEQEFLNARLASSVSGNPVRPDANSLAGVQGIYDIGGAYSNNPSVRSHLGKISGNTASRDVGAPLRPALGVTPELKKGNTYYQHEDGSVEVLPSEERSQSTQDMNIFGVNVPNASYIAGRLVDQVKGAFGYRKKPKVINGVLHVWDYRRDRWVPTLPVR